MFRGARARDPEPAWMENLSLLAIEAFPYVFCILLSAPCIVRLLTDQPEGVSDADSTCFWTAVALGAFFTGVQTQWSLAATTDVQKWLQRRREEPTLQNGSDHNVELLS